MKYSPLTCHARITCLAVITAGLALAGCEHAEPKPQHQTPRIAAVAKPAPMKSPKPVKPLDLSLDRLAGQFVVAQADATDPAHRYINPSRRVENRIEFGGKLLTDANIENYVDSIDGATVNITVKTR